MVLDQFTRRNLELVGTIRGASKSRGSLLSILDRTVTAMGARLLRKLAQSTIARFEPPKCAAGCGRGAVQWPGMSLREELGAKR